MITKEEINNLGFREIIENVYHIEGTKYSDIYLSREDKTLFEISNRESASDNSTWFIGNLNTIYELKFILSVVDIYAKEN